MTTVLVPTPLRRLTGGQAKVDVPGATVEEVVQNLEATYPGFGERLLDGDGQIKRFINVFVNEDEIRTLQGAETPVAAGDKVSIVPAMAGGTGSGEWRVAHSALRPPGCFAKSGGWSEL